MNFLLRLCADAGITTKEGAVRLIEKKKILMALLQFLTLVKAIQWTLGPLGWLVLATVSMSSVMFALNESVSNSCKIFSPNIL